MLDPGGNFPPQESKKGSAEHTPIVDFEATLVPALSAFRHVSSKRTE